MALSFTPYSLRGRYIQLAVVLTAIMLGSSYLGYHLVSKSRDQVSVDLGVRAELVNAIGNIQKHLLDAKTFMDLFLLEPANTHFQDRVFISIDAAVSLNSQLTENRWIVEQAQLDAISAIGNSLSLLEQETRLLFLTRADTTKQYPAMAVGNETMQPNRNGINNAFTVVFNELREDNTLASDTEVYVAFLNARHLWSQVLSNFRLYLANRVGSFNVAALKHQERSIATMFAELERQFKQLDELDVQGRLGFESAAAVSEMQVFARQWFVGFKQVKKIHGSDGWRVDAKLIRDNISPLITRISDQLSNLQLMVEASVAQNLNTLSNVAQRQTFIIWSVAITGITFFLLAVLSLERLIFRPIAEVARALKTEAFGGQGKILPQTFSRETYDLVDAFNEMTKQVHSRQADLEHQALHDALTSLPNRTLLEDRMDHDIHVARRDKRQLALLMLDLDRFKEVNDTLGHHTGDLLLNEVGTRLTSELREIDTVARLGGDEFAILLPDTGTKQASHVAAKICRSLETTFQIRDVQLYVSASIGIAVFPTHGADVETMLQRADVAMYVAKKNQSGFEIYDPDIDDYSIGRLAMVSELKKALQEDNLELHFQPKLDTASGRVVGLEALLRWQHPTQGYVPPDHVISLAEQTGLIHKLTYWVLDKALQQQSALNKKGYDLNMAINLSAFNFKDSGLFEQIEASLKKHMVPAESLTLEITEGVMMANPHHAVDTLTDLGELGVRVSIDDFGTGFSSLAYLKQFPVDELKIDKSFVVDMTEDESDAVIVHSTIELAHNLGLEVVAEGVESLQAWQALQRLGCDKAQGYFFSRPLNDKELENWLGKNFTPQETIKSVSNGTS